MTNIKTFIRQRPAFTYFALTFAISWGGVLLAAGGPGGFPVSDSSPEFQALLPFVVLAMVAGPVVSGILMIALDAGRAGYRDFFARLRTWRVGAAWYAAALLIAPSTVLATLLALSTFSANFLPEILTAQDKVAILLPGLLAGLTAGLFEETGWTGFAIPRLRSRYSIVATGLIVGFLWGLWHFIVAFWGSGAPSGMFSPLILLNQVAFYVGVLPAYRVLMVWVYDRTTSLLVTMLMHASLTAFTTFIFAPSTTAITAGERLIYHLALSGVLWIAVGAVVATSRGRLDHYAKPIDRKNQIADFKV
ncbi:MAG: CPBP family glutamic-type intramembrane protease [Anaerolineaceae bacterium]|jgi:membrane protease YdiL (CAAX protease family)